MESADLPRNPKEKMASEANAGVKFAKEGA